ncbi:MAG: hypothetical protein COA57_15070, partial [Flavobacteriales bacterium]
MVKSFRLRHNFLLFTFCFLLFTSFAQQQNLPLNKENSLWVERHLNHKENNSHTGLKPYLTSQIQLDSLVREEQKRDSVKTYQSLILRKIKNENLLIIDTGGFYLTIDPLFNFEYDYVLPSDTLNYYRNTRGLLVRANIGKKVSLMSSFYENQAFFPSYQDEFVNTYGVVPGKGRTKPFKQRGYDYAMASGFVSFTPFKQLSFQLGHNKHFIGDGYRSLLLSDNAFNYPFLKITTNLWKNRIQYSNIFASLQSLDRVLESTTPEATFQRKAGTFHYLSINAAKWLQIGLFEGTVWQR